MYWHQHQCRVGGAVALILKRYFKRFLDICCSVNLAICQIVDNKLIVNF